MPIGVSLGSAFLIGFIGGRNLIGLAFLVELICTVLLGFMAFRAPEKVAPTYTLNGTLYSSNGHTYGLPDTSQGYRGYTSGKDTHNGGYNTRVSPPVVGSGGTNLDIAHVDSSLRNQPINLDDLVITSYGSKTSVSDGTITEVTGPIGTCSECGHTNPTDARFCNECGQRLSTTT